MKIDHSPKTFLTNKKNNWGPIIFCVGQKCFWGVVNFHFFLRSKKKFGRGLKKMCFFWRGGVQKSEFLWGVEKKLVRVNKKNGGRGLKKNSPDGAGPENQRQTDMANL